MNEWSIDDKRSSNWVWGPTSQISKSKTLVFITWQAIVCWAQTAVSLFLSETGMSDFEPLIETDTRGF